MAAATDVDLVGDLDYDIFDFDLVEALDLDPSSADDEFCGGGACHYSVIFSDAEIVSHCRHGCEDGAGGDSGAAATCRWLLAGLGDDDGAKEEEGGSSSSEESGVTNDEPMTPVAEATAVEAMSAYVAELERFLLDDDGEQAEVNQGLLGVVDNYFAGDQLLAFK